MAQWARQGIKVMGRWARQGIMGPLSRQGNRAMWEWGMVGGTNFTYQPQVIRVWQRSALYMREMATFPSHI